MKSVLPIVLCALIAAGCQTTNDNRNVASAVKTAAFVGTSMALLEHPEWRSHFEQARGDLALVEQMEAIDFTMVLAIVHRLPVKELRSPEAALIITGAAIILADYGGEIPLDQIEQARPVIVALRQGIELGLSSSARAYYSTNAAQGKVTR